MSKWITAPPGETPDLEAEVTRLRALVLRAHKLLIQQSGPNPLHWPTEVAGWVQEVQSLAAAQEENHGDA